MSPAAHAPAQANDGVRPDPVLRRREWILVGTCQRSDADPWPPRQLGVPDPQYDRAAGVAALTQIIGLASRAEGEDRADHGFDLPRFDQLDDLALMSGIGLRDDLLSPRPDRGCNLLRDRGDRPAAATVS
jgi:hypothetical protein